MFYLLKEFSFRSDIQFVLVSLMLPCIFNFFVGSNIPIPSLSVIHSFVCGCWLFLTLYCFAVYSDSLSITTNDRRLYWNAAKVKHFIYVNVLNCGKFQAFCSLLFSYLFFFKLPSTQNKKHWGTDREDRGLSTLWNWQFTSFLKFYLNLKGEGKDRFC